MITPIRWLIHWIGQGMKLMLFALVASCCLIPLNIPIALLDKASFEFSELQLITKTGIVIGYIFCSALGLAVFTAVLASQLKDHPLRSFEKVKKKAPVDSV